MPARRRQGDACGPGQFADRERATVHQSDQHIGARRIAQQSGDLAAYEAYRARLREDSLAKENFVFSQAKRFILKEDRIFLREVSRPRVTPVPAPSDA